LWGDVHDFLSRSSVVNCDAVSNPNFPHPFPHPFLCVRPSCVSRVRLVLLNLGSKKFVLAHRSFIPLFVNRQHNHNSPSKQTNTHYYSYTIPKVFTYTHSHCRHSSRYTHSYSLVVSIRCQWSCSQASSTDRTTYTREIQQAC
jgi:hypothetical protein